MSCNFNCGNSSGENLVRHICEYTGETVTVFTSSGGLSGSGFTGVVLGVNGSFLRLVTQIGAPPACPISSVCHDDYENGPKFSGCAQRPPNGQLRMVGSVCDIPICQIVAFCHNAV